MVYSYYNLFKYIYKVDNAINLKFQFPQHSCAVNEHEVRIYIQYTYSALLLYHQVVCIYKLYLGTINGERLRIPACFREREIRVREIGNYRVF